MKRTIILLLDSFGVGGAEDADKFIGINSDDGTVQRQQVEQVGDRRDLIGFVIHLELTEDQSLA